VHDAPVDRCSVNVTAGGGSQTTDVRRSRDEASIAHPGIEEEYQIIDPQTRELKSYITEILSGDHLVLAQISLSCTVDCGGRTKVCGPRRKPAPSWCDCADRSELWRNGLKIAAAAPSILPWIDQQITPLERYLGVREDMGELAQRLLIFGTHIHIGIEDREFLIDALNVARYFLPHLMCLSTSSPFWGDARRGLKSYRSVVWARLPGARASRAPLRSWSEYTELVAAS